MTASVGPGQAWASEFSGRVVLLLTPAGDTLWEAMELSPGHVAAETLRFVVDIDTWQAWWRRIA